MPVMFPHRVITPLCALSAPPKTDEWEFLFGNEIPFKAEMHHLLYILPGIVAAVILGIALNVALEWLVSKIYLPASKSNYWALVGLGLTLYLILGTRFNYYVAGYSRWHKIIRPPWLTRPRTPPSPRNASGPVPDHHGVAGSIGSERRDERCA